MSKCLLKYKNQRGRRKRAAVYEPSDDGISMRHTPSSGWKQPRARPQGRGGGSGQCRHANIPATRFVDEAVSPPLLNIRESPLRQNLAATAAILLLTRCANLARLEPATRFQSLSESSHAAVQGQWWSPKTRILCCTATAERYCTKKHLNI